MFLFSPQVVGDWLHLPSEIRETLSSKLDAVVHTGQWSSIGIKQRLTLCEKMDNSEIVDRVAEVTGRWSLLLDRLFDRIEGNDPSTACEQLRLELQQPGKQRKNILDAMNLSPPAWKVLHTIRDYERVAPADLAHFVDGIGGDDVAELTEYLEMMSFIRLENSGLQDEFVLDPVIALSLTQA
jgi:hypothetical protein